MNQNKNIAIKMRRRGKTYNKISQKLGIAKSTLAGWFKDEAWSRKIKDIIERQTREERIEKMKIAHLAFWQNKYQEYRKEAYEKFDGFKNDPIFLVGLMLYWSEGDNNMRTPIVRITNSDYRILKLFGKFLIKYGDINVNKVRLYLMLYGDLDESICRKFWSEHINLPLTQFNKTQYIIGKHPTKRLAYGICNINICNRKLKEKINTWISLWFNKLA